MVVENRQVHVLVVDDEEDVREMMRWLLLAEGYQVTAVPDGASALQAVREGSFELVTMDLRMPGMSGVETLAELRRLAPDIAVIIVSGYVTPAEAYACLALGAVAVIRKPFSVERLIAMLREARARRKPGIPLEP